MDRSGRQLSVDDYLAGIARGDRAVLGRALTLVESDSPRHAEKAQQLLAALLPHSGRAVRVGITGVPGAGKSTLIEALGSLCTARGKRVAVLAVDPSSSISGGSILGDKTRMADLARDPRAFIRPSPSGGSLGGVARKTREAILVCEGAGFDVVFVETVGVGQSEIAVAEMVDLLAALTLTGAGDELQGVKRGVLEIADLVVINKADGDNAERARRTRTELLSALQLMRGPNAPDVLTCSALDTTGVEALWQTLIERWEQLREGGQLERRRSAQRLHWMWATVEQELLAALRAHPAVRSELARIERAVRDGSEPPTRAARKLLDAFRPEPPEDLR